MNVINIYSRSEKLISLMKKIIPIEGDYVFHVLGSHTTINPSQSNIFILGSLPTNEAIYPDAKYILCSKTPADIDKSQLNILYDLWPLPLTPSLVKFFFGKLQLRLKQEADNSQENLEHQKRILEMARQDYLTGLATRWYLQDFIETNKAEKYITCIYFDLDHFKLVNDTYGHQAGDRALAATAEMMQNEFADGFCARLGGDEFMIVLTGKRDILNIEQRVNDFMKHLITYYHSIPYMQRLSISAGISQAIPESSKTIDRLIHESDRALYEAKKNGRACCKLYVPSMG